MRLTALVVSVACAVSLCSAGVVLQDGMPVLWAQTAGQVTDLPITNGILTPDPWHYLHRMSLYRLLIAATDPFMGSMGTNATDSPIWGLTLQLGWMLTSGRFVDPTGTTNCGQPGEPMCISTQSWWGCVNYFVSALPFLSAAQQGFMGDGVQVQLQVPEGVSEYCTTYTDCMTQYPDAMAKWDAFFQGLRAAAESPLPDNEKKDALLGLYWGAQMPSIHSSAACNARKSHYSTEEVSFANSWLNAAEFVSAAYFQTNLQHAYTFSSPLPSRILRTGDKAPSIADLSAEENHSLKVFYWMDSVNSLLGGSMVRLWKSAMCSVNTRARGREMMEQLMVNPAFATSSFMSIVAGMAIDC